MTQPRYGRFDADGRLVPPPSGPPRPSKDRLPWLIVGGAVLLSGLGILLVVLLRDGGTGATTSASRSTASAAGGPSATPKAHRGLPSRARVADQVTSSGQARFAGSDQVALGWVQAMADGDFPAAYHRSCARMQQSAAGGGAGADPAARLGNYFFERTLSGRRFTAGSLDSVIYSQQSDSDIASFTLQLDSGEEFLLLVYVQSDGTVCDVI